MSMQNYVRLPLKNAYNVRELGGYPCKDGQVTKWHRFLRADDMCNLDEPDMQFLSGYGVTSVIDLRSEKEMEVNPNPFTNNHNVEYINIPLAVGNVDDITKVFAEKPCKILCSFYLATIKEAFNRIKEIFEYISNHSDGCILFHCAAGKDRTGIISMLLLGLADVNKYDIISNYEVTYTHLRQSPIIKMSENSSYPIEIMYSRADYIEHVIDYILDSHGSFENYLLSIGLSENVLFDIKKSFLS